MKSLSMAVFGHYLRNYRPKSIVYETALQTSHDQGACMPRLSMRFTEWDVYLNPNLLLLRCTDGSLRFDCVRRVLIEAESEPVVADVICLNTATGSEEAHRLLLVHEV